jgi:hypothetical protein
LQFAHSALLAYGSATPDQTCKRIEPIEERSPVFYISVAVQISFSAVPRALQQSQIPEIPL